MQNMIQYLESVYQEWLSLNDGEIEEPTLCMNCYEEKCDHEEPKWPVSHLLNKLRLEDSIWTPDSFYKR